jgi:hypothetical protein
LSEVGDRFTQTLASSQQGRQGRASDKADHYHYDHDGHYFRVVLSKPPDQIHTFTPIENEELPVQNSPF